MWTIRNLTVQGGSPSDAYMSDGKPVVGTRRGPAGASFRLYTKDRGMLDITDMGQRPGGPRSWLLVINGGEYWYEGEGGLGITIGSDGTFIVTGDDNAVKGRLLPLPVISPTDLKLLNEMKERKLIPYGELQPGQRPYSEVEHIAKQYFAFSPSWWDLGLTIYDWTTADFFRMTSFFLFRFTAIPGHPLSDIDIINGIWTSDWPPYTPQNPTFMASMMMKPARTRQQVADQYAEVHRQLRVYLDALMRLTHSSMYAMPRTSTLAKPMLYSGQVDVRNFGQDVMAAYFRQYPGNAGPVGEPMGMPIEEALRTFMRPGSRVQTKSIISFTDSAEDARRYSNGIVLEMSPPVGSAVWPQSAYVTPLSNGPEKTEYTYVPESKWMITGSRIERIGGRPYTIISVLDVG